MGNKMSKCKFAKNNKRKNKVVNKQNNYKK